MPQFEFATFSAQIFWLLVSFTLLTAYSAFISVPKIKRILEERWNKTDGYRVEAKQLTEEATVVTVQGEEQLKRTREKAYEIIMDAQKQATIAALEKKSHFTAHINRQIQEAEQRLLIEKNNILQELALHIEALSDQVMAKLIGNPLHSTKQGDNTDNRGTGSTQAEVPHAQ
jgi:F-type H+-transporting ATPase subunit b